jgi:hypothetical protein
MPHALNLTIPIAQDHQTLERLQQMKARFSTHIQPRLETALRRSKLVHFARVVVIQDKYIQVVLEYDSYAHLEFFRRELNDLFQDIFSFADLQLDPKTISDERAFYRALAGLQRRSLGKSTDGSLDFNGNIEGYLFSAYGSRTVTEILSSVE